MTHFTPELDDYSLQKLTEAARAADLTPGRMAAMMLEAWLRDEVVPVPGDAPPGVDEPARAWAGAADERRGTVPAESGRPVVELVDPLRSRLAGMAKQGGVSPEVLAAAVLQSRLFDPDDFDWQEGGDPRTVVSDPIVEDELRDWKEVRPELEVYLEEKLKARQ